MTRHVLTTGCLRSETRSDAAALSLLGLFPREVAIQRIETCLLLVIE